MSKNFGMSEEHRLWMQLKVSEGKGLLEDLMREMAKFKFTLSTGVCSLKHMLKITVVFFKKHTPEGSPIYQEEGLNCNHIEE